ncbi:MAG: hypothetical protein NZZ60_00975 [Bacteroidia bacterium]|nr:hypothetical protein [Bacteroidia bacterium]
MSSSPILPPRKLTLEEAWNTLTVFFISHELEEEIDRKADYMVSLSERFMPFLSGLENNQADIESLLKGGEEAIIWLLAEIGLSEEKFLRIVSLLRKIGIIPEPLDKEWTLKQLVNKILNYDKVRSAVAWLFTEGSQDERLAQYIPRFYLETLDIKRVMADDKYRRRIRYKQSLIGTYGGRKGYYVEQRIQNVLDEAKVPYEKGRSPLLKVNLDFAIPSLYEPQIVLMSSFQETTSSGQSTKARDMEKAYRDLQELNSRERTQRIFINFADGGGWLARKADFERIVKNCDYFLNLQHLNLLKSVVKYYFDGRSSGGKRK